jgi:hypothetical protein
MVYFDRSETREGLTEYLGLLEKLRSMSLGNISLCEFIEVQTRETEEKLNRL